MSLNYPTTFSVATVFHNLFIHSSTVIFFYMINKFVHEFLNTSLIFSFVVPTYSVPASLHPCQKLVGFFHLCQFYICKKDYLALISI